MPRTERQIVDEHLRKICDDAGLSVMVEVFEIIRDHEHKEHTVATFLALDAQDVTMHYERYIGPVIDQIVEEIT